jgi:SpoVK/Ycf46/Vps4 family AAA+-type ATPase
MQLRDILGFHSGINNLTFLLLHEATLLGQWLQTFRQTVRVSFSKGQKSKTILTVEYITSISQRRGGLNVQLAVSRT